MGLIKFILLTYILFMSITVQSKGIIKIQLKYVSFDLETDTHVSCKKFELSFKEQIRIKNITDKHLLNQFTCYLRQLKNKKKTYSPDVRAKIYIYYNDGSIKALCIGKFGFEWDGYSFLSPNFIQFIRKMES